MNEPVTVTVTILSDDATIITAPDGVTVNIEYALADGDDYCGCGSVIRKDDDGTWYHIDAPEIWGDDHDAAP